MAFDQMVQDVENLRMEVYRLAQEAPEEEPRDLWRAHACLSSAVRYLQQRKEVSALSYEADRLLDGYGRAIEENEEEVAQEWAASLAARLIDERFWDRDLNT